MYAIDPHRVASRATPAPGAGRARPHDTRGLRATRAEAPGRDTESIDDVSPLWDRDVMSYDDPVEELRRTNDGREGFCQIPTTPLLVGGTYP